MKINIEIHSKLGKVQHILPLLDKSPSNISVCMQHSQSDTNPKILSFASTAAAWRAWLTSGSVVRGVTRGVEECNTSGRSELPWMGN